MVWKIARYFVVGLLVVVILGCLASNEESIHSTETKEYLNISFREFDSLFGERGSLTDVGKKKKFETEYDGKYVRWTCVLNDLAEETKLIGSSKTYVMHMNCGSQTPVTVFIRENQKNKAIEIHKDSQVTFEGKLDGYPGYINFMWDDVPLSNAIIMD